MDKKPEPLMFIHTVSTPVLDNHSQQVYDSRYHKKKERSSINAIKSELLIKIDMLIGHYQNNKPIKCEVVISFDKKFEGFLFKRTDELLFIRNNEQDYQVGLKSVQDIIIQET